MNQSKIIELVATTLYIAFHDHQQVKLRDMVDEQDIGIGEVISRGKELNKDLNEKRADWKSKLSTILNSEQVFFSLFVLAFFFVGYTIGNSFIHRKDGKNEDDIIDRCYCRSSHQKFYRSWFIIWCLIWLLLHGYTYVGIRFPPVGKPKNLWKYFKKLLNCCKKGKDSVDSSEPDTHTIQHFIDILWFQYYKLFVVGYPSKHDEKILLDSNHEPAAANEVHTNDESNEAENLKVTCCYCIGYEANEDCTCGCDQNVGCFVNSCRCISHLLLVTVKFLAQLFTIPLLFLQVFDTYALLCFNPQWFCSDTTEYDLHLAQALIAILFYFCLAISQLAGTMLAYNPWPKKDSA